MPINTMEQADSTAGTRLTENIAGTSGSEKPSHNTSVRCTAAPPEL